MTKYPFKVNGADFSAHVHKNGYFTDTVPNIAWQAKTISGPDRRRIDRWKHILSVRMNPMPAEAAAALCAELQKSSLTIEFHSFQTGGTVSVKMTIDSMPEQHQLTARGTDWLAGTELYFSEP